MKICFTQEEVKKIVLDYAQRVLNAELNHVELSNYSYDYCTLTYVEPEPAGEAE